MRKIIHIAVIILLFAFLGEAQNVNYPVMHSNEENVNIFVNGGKNSWTIDPEQRPDVYRLYNVVKKVYNIEVVSDIDSLSFLVEVNKPIYFWIVYQRDSALIKIDFIDYIPNTLTDGQKLYALGLLWSETKYNFAFFDRLKVDWDSLYQSYIPKILATTNDYDFYDVLKRFIYVLKDGHSGVHFYEESLYTDHVPIGVRYFGDDLQIVRVREDLSEAYPLGSKILEVNGLPLSEYMEQYVKPYVSTDFEPSVRNLSASRLFASKKNDNRLNIKYETPDGKILVNTPPRDGNANPGESVGYQQRRSDKVIEIEWEEDGIAVLRFNTFNDWNGKLIPYFETLKDTLYHAKGIVIDIRQNGGGSTDVAEHLLQYMIKDSCFLSIGSQTKINDGVKRANGNWIPEYEDFYKMKAYEAPRVDTIYIPDSIKRFDVPMVVLISNFTFSAAEDFLIMLYERSDRPKIIGYPSFGSTGSPLVIWNWPDENGFARICARRCLFPYSLKPLYEGIMPDIIVEYTFEEYMSGRDKEMEAAISELKKSFK